MDHVEIKFIKDIIKIRDNYNHFVLEFGFGYLNRVKRIFEKIMGDNTLEECRDILFSNIVEQVDPSLNKYIDSNYIVVKRVPIIYNKLCDFIKPKQYSYGDLYKLSTTDLISIYQIKKELTNF